MPIDVRPTEITCSGDPASIVNPDDSTEAIAIVFKPDGQCRIVEDAGSDYSVNVILAIDSDPGDDQWDGETGTSWGSTYLGKRDPGIFTRTFRYTGGRKFLLSVLIQVRFVSGGPTVKLNVGSVTIFEVAS